jgi:hypothetical protein
MTAAEKLHQLIQTLPEAQIHEVLHFAEFLQQKQDSTTATLHEKHPGLQVMDSRAKAVRQMRGLLKTDQPAPTDQEVVAMRKDRRVEKYL